MSAAVQPLPEPLLKELREGLLAAAQARGCKPEDAADAVQEVFLKIIRNGAILKMGQFAPPQRRSFLSKLLGWQLTNARRARLRNRRGRGFEVVPLEEWHEGLDPETPLTLLDRAEVGALLEGFGFEEEMFERGRLTPSQRGARTRLRRKAAPVLAKLLA